MDCFRSLRFPLSSMLLVATSAVAQDLTASLDCHADPQRFIEQLIQNEDIKPDPMKTSDHSVNTYALHDNHYVTALGFPVKAVFATQSKGTSVTQHAEVRNSNNLQSDEVPPSDAQVQGLKYGIVVMAGQHEVIERLRQMSSPAGVKEVLPLIMTAVICQK